MQSGGCICWCKFKQGTYIRLKITFSIRLFEILINIVLLKDQYLSRKVFLDNRLDWKNLPKPTTPQLGFALWWRTVVVWQWFEDCESEKKHTLIDYIWQRLGIE